MVSALVVGFVLNRILHHWTKKFQNTWGEVVFALLESLPLPLLVLAALYAGLELLTLPLKYERIGTKLIFALLILILFYFPAKVMILFLRRLGQRKPGLEQVAQPARDGVEGLLADPAPTVRFNPGFGDSSLDFTLAVHVRKFEDQYLVQSELRKRILARFQEEGIEMPFPTRALVLDESTRKLLGGAAPKP